MASHIKYRRLCQSSNLQGERCHFRLRAKHVLWREMIFEMEKWWHNRELASLYENHKSVYRCYIYSLLNWTKQRRPARGEETTVPPVCVQQEKDRQTDGGRERDERERDSERRSKFPSLLLAQSIFSATRSKIPHVWMSTKQEIPSMMNGDNGS